MFRTCCIMHNILLEYDKRDYKWDVDIDDTDEDVEEADVIARYRARVGAALKNGVGCGQPIHNDTVNVDEDASEYESGFFEQRNRLIVNFKAKVAKGKVTWLQ